MAGFTLLSPLSPTQTYRFLRFSQVPSGLTGASLRAFLRLCCAMSEADTESAAISRWGSFLRYGRH
eukprot:3937719-Rhodomonas_salina.1